MTPSVAPGVLFVGAVVIAMVAFLAGRAFESGLPPKVDQQPVDLDDERLVVLHEYPEHLLACRVEDDALRLFTVWPDGLHGQPFEGTSFSVGPDGWQDLAEHLDKLEDPR